MAQTSAYSPLFTGDDRLLISGKIRFSNQCKYMPMAVAVKGHGTITPHLIVESYTAIFGTHCSHAYAESESGALLVRHIKSSPCKALTV